MCGIVGIVENERRGETLAGDVAAASARLANRGPDDAGLWTGEGAAFAHRRLSILDTSRAGHQPMTCEAGRYVIVFNGEIYNFREVRRKLDAHVDRWHSDTDTEVILAAYVRWGVGCLTWLRGMFAFAIWDTQEKVLFAARDRMGVKPFYYSRRGGRFSFASRPAALRAANPALSGRIDPQALRLYLEQGHVGASLSFWDEFKQLPPAHYLTLKQGHLSVQRYWDARGILAESSWEKRKEEDLLDELDELTARAVAYRMVSDVPLGAFLSGGVDSSLVVAMMARQSTRAPQTFTIGLRDPELDESGPAQAIARHLRTDHRNEYLLEDDLLGLLDVFVGNFDEPFADPSAFPAMAVSRLASRHVRVTLGGDGGDELFGGYNYYRVVQRLAPLLNSPKPVRTVAQAFCKVGSSTRRALIARMLRESTTAGAFGLARNCTRDVADFWTGDILERTWGVIDLYQSIAADLPPSLSVTEEAMRIDTLSQLPDRFLQKLDLATMAFSLEGREPLVDHELVEWSCRLPLKWKINGSRTKYLLRKLAARYVPESLLDGAKRGFGVPVGEWLRGRLYDWAREHIEDSSLFVDLPISQKAVQRLFGLHVRREGDFSQLIWGILMLLAFMDRERVPRTRSQGIGMRIAGAGR